MNKLPAELLVLVAGNRSNLATLVTTCRRMRDLLEGHLYRGECLAAKLQEREDELAIFQAASDPTHINTLKKWAGYIARRDGTSSDRGDWYLGSALRAATSAGNKAAVLLLLEHDAPKDLRDSERRSPLMCSIVEEHVYVAKLLIKAGCNVSLSTKFSSPMLAACRLGDRATEIVRMMLDRGADPYALVDDGIPSMSTAPGEAAKVGSLGLLRLFEARTVDLHSSHHHDVYTLPICTAMVNRQHTTLEFLLKGGHYPAWDTRRGKLLLSAVRQFATAESMRLLFENTELTINSLDTAYCPFLISTIERDDDENEDMIRFLVSEGANINCCKSNGEPALTCAILRCSHNKIEIVGIFIRAGADLTQRGPDGGTPLILASTLSDGGDLVKIILEHNSDNVDAKDNKTRQPCNGPFTRGATSRCGIFSSTVRIQINLQKKEFQCFRWQFAVMMVFCYGSSSTQAQTSTFVTNLRRGCFRLCMP
ncbi:Ankyrin repeat-containing domain protein [Beauveria brongniartii RCEF 3172]|uniref:Ankyrin repeat-containing domain protein n=1 Tax=Beauveria brongniartii RCEF 3172 TaxID=1081107 RepID=A0A167K3J0_9HYPO|nr:Ankyrin repeat-containing domain protein [Beauveria brongniartii RCEF 3172]